MSYDLCISNIASGECEFISLGASSRVRSIWIPVAKERGLELIELIGEWYPVVEENRDQWLTEFAILRDYAVDHLEEDDYFEVMRDKCDELIRILRDARFDLERLDF